MIFVWWALLILVVLAAGAVGLTAFRYGLLPTLVRGAPYVPTHVDSVQAMMELAELTPNDRVVDLGSGDGRIIHEAARAGVREAIGYEIDPVQVRQSQRFADEHGLKQAHFFSRSFWDVSLQDIDVVFLYTLPIYQRKMAEKCLAELSPGARVISNIYPLPGLTLVEERGAVKLYKIV